jgi:signal transduction histidine kinase
MRTPSVRTRLALMFGALFLAAGAGLLVVNYVLVSEALPEPVGFVSAALSPTDAEAATSAPTSFQVVEPEQTAEVVPLVSDYRDSALRTVLLVSAATLVFVGLLAALLGWLMAHRTLRPVHRITATARRLSAERLDRRINLDGPGDELKELADTFDGMLDRLADSFDSQRRFVANASHELRTPLAVQRALIEVALADPTASPELVRLGSQLLHTNERNERLIDGLLLLARSDRGLTSREPVRLDRLAAKVCDAAAELAEGAGVTLHRDLTPRAVAGDPVLLERLVTNLVHNAIHYNTWHGTVTVTTADDPALTITNTGAPIPAAEVDALFEPFRRLGRDRTAHRNGAGLGLSIVRSVATAHDGTVTATPNPTGGLQVEVTFPASALTTPTPERAAMH